MADGSVIIKVDADTKRAQADLARLERELQKTAAAMEKTGNERNGIAEKLEAARDRARELEQEIKNTQQQYNANASAIMDTRLTSRDAMIDPQVYERLQEEQRRLIQLQEEQKAELAAQNKEVARLEAQEDKLTSKLQLQTEEYDKQTEAVGEMRQAMMESGGGAMDTLRNGAQSASEALKGSLKTLMKYALAFVSLKKVISYIREGLRDYASKDPETKKNIDELKASLNGLKLAWGAAFAPILNAVAPILQTLINWLTAAANAINAFFSALSGRSTYKKAVANMDSVKDAAGGAGAAAEEAKKQIMGFDEINRLDDNKSGGGGGGGGGGSGLGDLEETEINPKLMKAVEWMKDHLEEIALIAGTIGAILLAWKLSKLLGVGFDKILGSIMIIYGAIMLITGAIDAWKNGLNDSNMAKMLGGIAVAAAGAALAFGAIGAGIALVVGGIVFLVLGFKELVTQGELTDEAFRALATGILLVGAGFALLTGSWIPLLIAAVVALVLTIVKYWDEIKAFTIKIWTAIKDFFVKLWESIKKAASDTWESIKEKASETWNNIKTTASTTWNGIKSTILGVWDGVKTGVQERWNDFVGWVHGAWDSLKQWWQGLSLGSFHIPHPHFDWTYSEASGLIAKAMEFVGIPPMIPHLNISWYAKGGIVNGATLFGAGEAGREAIIPLERNTGWIKKVALELLDAMGDKYAGALSGMPAMAMGGIAPPRAMASSGSIFSDGDIERLVSGLSSAVLGGGNGSNTIYLVVDGRKMAEVVTKHQNDMSRGYGK